MTRRGLPCIALSTEGEVRACAPEAARMLGAMSPDAVVGHSLSEFLDPTCWPFVEGVLAIQPSALADAWLPTVSGTVLQVRLIDRAASLFELVDDTGRAMAMEQRHRSATEDARASLAASVARELNDPMAIVQGRLELLLEMGSSDPERVARHLRVALDHARRVSGTLHLLRLVGRPAVEDHGVVTIEELVQFAVQEAGPHIGADQLQVDVHPQDLSLGGTVDLLAQVMAHLFGRLDELCARGGRAYVRARRLDSHVMVDAWAQPRGARAADPDQAVPGEDDPRLDVGVVGPVVARIGGSIAGMHVGGGILFRLTLPLPSLPRTRKRSGDECTLAVGQAVGRFGVAELLGREGFDVVTADTAGRALELLDEREFDGLVVSLSLPDMSGLALSREAQRRQATLDGRSVLICEHRPSWTPSGISVCSTPIDRVELLQALGRRARRRRR